MVRGRGVQHHHKQPPQWKPSHVLGQMAQPSMLSAEPGMGQVAMLYGQAGPLTALQAAADMVSWSARLPESTLQNRFLCLR